VGRLDIMSDILIVEDDRDIADLIAHYLERAGHQGASRPIAATASRPPATAPRMSSCST
jgi:CheY-like chemotaxis protein